MGRLDREPGLEGVNSPSEGTDLPADTVLVDPALDVVKTNLLGLLAVGVEPLDAFSSFTNKVELRDMVKLAVELVPDGLTLVKLLYGLLPNYPGFLARMHFADACREQGVNPLGVALCAASGEEARRHLVDWEDCPEDDWRVQYIQNGSYDLMAGFVFNLQHLSEMSDFRLIIPGRLWITNGGNPWNDEADWKPVDVAVLEAVGGPMDASKSCRLTFSGIKRLSGDLRVDSSEGVSFPELVGMGGGLQASGAKGAQFPKLSSVERAVEIRSAEGFVAPRLEAVGWDLQASNVSGLKLESLTKIGGSLALWGAKEFNFPNLLTVGGVLDLNSAKDGVLSLLTCVGDRAEFGSSQFIALPSLAMIAGECHGLKGSQGAYSIYLPKLSSVDGAPYRTDSI